MNPVIVISERDNVATALEALDAGQVIDGPIAFTVREPIPRGHKVSMRAIPAGASVIKYGNTIGVATARHSPRRARAHAQRVERARTRRPVARPSRRSTSRGSPSPRPIGATPMSARRRARDSRATAGPTAASASATICSSSRR